MPMPSPAGPQQNIMTEGPGLRQRARQTNATLASVSPVQEPMRPMAPSPKDRVNPKGAPYGSRAPEKRIDTGDMTKSLGTFHKGTNYVPKTGNYTLEKGEAVVPKEKNMMNPYSKITEGAKKSPKKTLKSMHVRPAHDGSHIIEHHHHSPHSMEEHTAPDMKGLMAHMQEHAPTMQAMPPAEEQTGAQAQDSAVGASPAGM